MNKLTLLYKIRNNLLCIKENGYLERVDSRTRDVVVVVVVVVVMLPVDTTMAVMCHVLFCLLHALSWLRMPMRLLHVLPQCRHM